MKYHSRRIWIVSLIVLLNIMVISFPASGSMVLALDLAELALASDHVVIAEVRSTLCEPRDGTFVTRYSLRVLQSVAGSTTRNDEIEILVAGGRHGNLGVTVHGTPTFEPDTRYLFFLRERGAYQTIVGMSQGALPIIAAPQTRELMVYPPSTIPQLVRRHGGRLIAAQPALITPRPLEAVIEEVRRARHGL